MDLASAKVIGAGLAAIGVGVAATLFSTVMSLLELFVAILQAYVFTLLSAMYFGQATAEHEHGHADGHH